MATWCEIIPREKGLPSHPDCTVEVKTSRKLRGFVEELKRLVPDFCRVWDEANFAWRVDPEFEDIVETLARQHYDRVAVQEELFT